MSLPLIVGISGASGAIYGVRLLQALKKNNIATHLVISKSAAITLKEEMDLSVDEVRTLSGWHHVFQQRRRRGDFQRLVQDPRHGDHPVLDPHRVRHRLRHHR